jgi:endonuclease/exonuclease/phosphatase family metal-dependent hydrolase
MKILSFNVSWECMTNSHIGTAKNLGVICNNLNSNKFQCRDNLLIYLKNLRETYNQFDIMCLQEASNLDNLKLDFDNNFLFDIHQSGKEKMITIINLIKFKLIDIIKSEFKKGRPFCIYILESKIDKNIYIIVNLHYCSDFKNDKCISITKLLTQSLQNKYPNYEIKFSNSRIIVAGDFNYHLHQDMIQNKNNILSFQPFYNLKILKTLKPFESCCYYKNFNDKINNITDLIFDSYSINQIKVLKPEIPISDHLPVISIIP